MGWKSTVDITRAEAKSLIIKKLTDLEQLSDTELVNMVEELGYGDNPNLAYFGHNFMIVD
jgi:hypothetical protein|tara:strand:- start:2232 stop:2411 length:180 start_codon:yes stop_codon:yes gene_type:complete